MAKSEMMKRKAMEIDRISELPDDIMANIISRLAFKQAVATSLISTRWRDLWKFYSGCLDFDGSDAVNFSDSDGENKFDFEGSKSRSYDDWSNHVFRSHHGTTIEQYGSIISKKSNFVDRVNHVFRSHQGTTFERLRICLDPRDSSPEVIDSWVQLALAKRVQFIDLDFECFESPIKHQIEYELPIRSHCGSQSLKSLILNNVNISGDALESIVDKCPNLEDLSITGSYSIEVFKLYSLSLKQLTLWFCDPLLDIKISAPNLLSFAWAGFEDSNLVLQDVPQLKYVRISEYPYPIQSHHSQLVTLELDDGIATGPRNRWNINLPEFSNLRHLTMKLYSFNGDHTFCFIVAYLKAAPSLEKFTLEVYAQKKDVKLSEAVLKMAIYHCYKNLKSVEFKGFGETKDVEFIRYLRNHAPLLEKIVIDLCPPYLGSPAETEHRLATEYLEARNRVINFGASLDCHVTVV